MKSKTPGVAWWLAVAVGVGLVVFPEPATTATGVAILGVALGSEFIE
jgi:hypothetical protein